MSFDTSDEAKEKIHNSLKENSRLGDRSSAEKTQENFVKREKLIGKMFKWLTAPPTRIVRTHCLPVLRPEHLKQGPSHGSDLFRDIANAVCRDNVTNFHTNEDGSVASHGRYSYSWDYRDFHIVIFSFRESRYANLCFYISIDDMSKLSGSDTDSEHGLSDEYSVYTVMRHLHNRLSLLECPFKPAV